MSPSTGGLPTPTQGLVVTFNYLWAGERDSGSDEARKARPCMVVAVAAPRNPVLGSALEIVVVPITHTPPMADTLAMSVPDQHKAAMGLDPEPCWVVYSEMNTTVWPGYDLVPTPRSSNGWTRGTCPRSFLIKILGAIRTAIEDRVFKTGTRR